MRSQPDKNTRSNDRTVNPLQRSDGAQMSQALYLYTYRGTNKMDSSLLNSTYEIQWWIRSICLIVFIIVVFVKCISECHWSCYNEALSHCFFFFFSLTALYVTKSVQSIYWCWITIHLGGHYFVIRLNYIAVAFFKYWNWICFICVIFIWSEDNLVKGVRLRSFCQYIL